MVLCDNSHLCNEWALSDLKLDLYRNLLETNLEISVPDFYTRDQLHEILKMFKIYKTKFPATNPGDLVAIFNDEDFVDIKDSNGVLLFGREYCLAPCAICNIAVADGDGKLGQGLNCSGCSRWFHNHCNVEPLSNEAFLCLSDSPEYVRVVCPHCLVGERNLADSVNSVNSELECIKTNFSNEFQTVKQSIADLSISIKKVLNDDICHFSDISSKLDNVSDLKSLFSSHNLQCVKSYNLIADKVIKELQGNKEDQPKKSSITVLQLSVQEIERNLKELDKKMVPGDSFIEDTISGLKDSINSAAETIADLERSLNATTASYEAALDTVVSQANRLDSLDISALTSTLTLSMEDVSNRIKQEVLLPSTVDEFAGKVADLIPSKMELKSVTITEQNSLKLDSDNSCSGKCVTKIEAKLDDIIGCFSSDSGLKELTPTATPWSSVTSKKPTALKGGTVTTSPKGMNTPKQHSEAKHLKNEMDVKKTITIGNVNDSSISNSAKIKSAFNKCFPRMEIIHCKRAINGFILVEVDTAENARKVVRDWDGSKFFKIGTGGNTYVHLLEDARAKAIIEDVDKELTDEFLTEEVQKLFPNASARRFKNKYGPTHVVLLTFTSKADLEKASEERLLIGNTIYRTRTYEVKKKLTQCYKCFSFNHIARNCAKNRVCPFCCGYHEEKDCEIKKNNETNKFKCVNCDGNHSAVSKECNVYKKVVTSREKYND